MTHRRPLLTLLAVTIFAFGAVVGFVCGLFTMGEHIRLEQNLAAVQAEIERAK